MTILSNICKICDIHCAANFQVDRTKTVTSHTPRSLRLPRLLEDLTIAKANGRYLNSLRDFARTDLLKILDDCHGRKSTLVASQLPVDIWHNYIGEPTLANAILDWLIHNAYRLNLNLESIRKKRLGLTAAGLSEQHGVTRQVLRRFAARVLGIPWTECSKCVEYAIIRGFSPPWRRFG